MKADALTINHRIAEYESLCRDRGDRVTIQKRRVLELLLKRDDHPTAEQVFQDVRQELPDVSRTTVYRILENLSELGFTRKVHHAGAVTRFDSNVEHHHHLVCHACNTVIDVDLPPIPDVIVPRGLDAEFEVHDYSVYFTGLCRACRDRQRAARAHTREVQR